jgi:plasmid stabilization system protein ParE
VSGYALHPGAFTDLDDIREYIARNSADAADRVIPEIFDAVRAVVLFPQQGHRRPDLTSRPLRFTSVYEYLIAYAPDCGESVRERKASYNSRMVGCR